MNILKEGGGLKESGKTIDQLCVNTIRTLAMDAVQKANSGHPGMPMGMAPAAYVLWTRILRHNPRHPSWFDRDRFVLSAGHGSMLLYSLLHLTGYDLDLKEIMRFRQYQSRTPGHPEAGETPGVETTTGPLGQGFGNGIGMAVAERHLAARFNTREIPLVSHRIFAIVSDGDLMEGVASEAASAAGHWRLGNLIYLYDDNGITIEGSTRLAFTEDVSSRFTAYGWHVEAVDGEDLAGIEQAIERAVAETERPSLIRVRTHIAHGSPNKQDTAAAHGSPLGVEEIRLTKQNLGWPEDAQFLIPPEALELFRCCIARGEQLENQWNRLVENHARMHPELHREWTVLMNGGLEAGWEDSLPALTEDSKPMATREASGRVLKAIYPHAPALLGGSADLAPSNNTFVEGFGTFGSGSYAGRNFHFGVREHGMGAILNGIALHGGLIPYGATFLVFSDYMRPSVRLASLMKAHVIYVWTHDSFAVGEDGPTHQPVEHAASLRSIPGMVFIRPADGAETTEAWRAALRHRQGPVGLALTRQKLPYLDRRVLAPADGLHRGAYILQDSNGPPEVILIASGSEVSLALGVGHLLQREGVKSRVVSMPCWEFFQEQDPNYRSSVIRPQAKLRVSIEAGSAFGWERWVGEDGLMIALDRFGASAPADVLAEAWGFTASSILEKVLQRLA